MIQWQHSSFSELSIEKYHKIMVLRQKIFIVEQTCIYQDADEIDPVSTHYMGWKDDQLIAYARIYELSNHTPRAMSIGRVVTSQDCRGQGIGQTLISKILAYIQETAPNRPIIISAQYYLVDLYKKFGFTPQGEPYLEDGIEHIEMVK